MLVILCVALGLAVGAFLPDLIRALPERSDPATSSAEGGEVGARAESWPTYRDIAAWRYARPLLAVMTAVVFGLLARARGDQADLVAFLALGAVGVALGYVDVRRHRLPDLLTLPSYPILGALLAAAAMIDGTWAAYGRAWLGAAALFAVYLLLALINPAGMGLGDVKLAGVLGLALGWLGWGQLVLGGFAGFLLGGVGGLLLMAMRRATLRSSVPYGPFMLTGALVAICWGGPMVSAYTR